MARNEANAFAGARAVNASAIPVIDVGDLHAGSQAAFARAADEMTAAAKRIGFFYVRNHGVERSIINEAFAVAREFFARPAAHKGEVAINALHRGFLAAGEAKMYDGARPDLKESFVWGLDLPEDDADYLAGRPLTGPNQWPADLPRMREVLTAYFDACNALGWLLFRAFATALGAPPDYFVKRIDRPMTRCSVVYYPPQPPELGPEQFGVAPHTDFGCITFVAQDEVGGLQVRDRSGEWVTAPPIEDTFVVNVGDLMARWTNDRFMSTPHRVVNASGRERVSLAAFVDPNYETVIAPVVASGDTPRYEPTTCGEYLVWRLGKSFAYRRDDPEAGRDAGR